jgi:hypothetical protein
VETFKYCVNGTCTTRAADHENDASGICTVSIGYRGGVRDK